MADIKKTQLAVIGAGPGGYAAAFHAADLGLEVSLIDVQLNPGGTCLYRGCIPSKALLHVAKLINDAREAEEWGLTFTPPELNLDKMRDRTNLVIEQMTGGLGQLCRARKITYIRARASFVNSRRLILFNEDGSDDYLDPEHIIIATGSRPTLFGPLIKSERLMNSTNALQINRIPSSLLVIGGGYIGLELGSVYAALGSEVTVVEATDRLLTGVDHDLVVPLQKRLEQNFKGVLLSTKVMEMKELEDGVRVQFENGAGEKSSAVYDKVLISVGRKPNSQGLNLADTGVKTDSKGFIVVDEQRRTAEPHIFAIGDVTGQPMLAHKASAEGKVAAAVIAGKKAAFEPMAIPAVVFTDPEIAICGETENSAKAKGLSVHVAKFPWTASGRASTLSSSDGLTKILVDAETSQILGMGIVGNSAGELISEGALAIEMGAVAEDLDMTIHPHPTLSETVMESAAAIFGQSTHIYRPAKK
ncbi:MAG: dihydrolipoyl dehydrogenase [Candidatus Hydrogenedentes bacterium]|jgi:dihydrolipoamide dehydrogenase|nr:dihydrolipoyl dehydrogenase [Candidatus Hydrogenedentota bacterium]